jgi:general secretion pathway protein G
MEMVIALVVVAILSGVAVPVYTDYVEKAEIKTAVRDIRFLEGAIERHHTEFERYPNQLAGVVKPELTDPWGNSYRYLNLQIAPPPGVQPRKDKNLVPINSDYDLYSMGKDGETKAPLTPKVSHDDVIRANDGAFVGLAWRY